MPSPAKKPLPDPRRDLEKELAAAGALKHQLREAFGDELDVELLADMIEGETDLDGAIDGALKQMAMDVANAQGLEKFESTMAARRKRLCDRVETMRTMILNAMDIAELKSLDRPIARVTRKSVAPKLLIVDEAAIPTAFFKQPEPVLSKAELTSALKNRRDTLEQRLAELNEQRKSGAIDDEALRDMRESLHAAFPAIPGAELDNGSATVQIRWS